MIGNDTPRVLTIAGSDSGGGAGIQADLKAFSACRVFGMTAITAITAQNTEGVRDVLGLPPDLVRGQIRAVVEDIGVDAIKTGMLYDEGIIRAVVEEIDGIDVPIIVDPVMVAKSGDPLLRPEAMDAMRELMVPRATVLTPNRHEAEVLSGMRIESLEDMVEAGRRILEGGTEYVVVKGGHVQTGGYVVDVVVHGGGVEFYKAWKLGNETTHGTGCSFASFIASCIARGHHPLDAIRRAKELVTEAIRLGFKVGHGVGPVNPMAALYKEADKYTTVEELEDALAILSSNREVSRLMPETRMNIVYALDGAKDEGEVAGIPGRITTVGDRLATASQPRFGGSRHVARAVLTAMKHDPDIRSAVNIRFDEHALKVAEGIGLRVSHYDRGGEPREIKEREGASIPWGVERAIERIGKVPDIIYHRGDVGKEPMIIVFGRNPTEVVNKVLMLAKTLSSWRE